MTKSADTETEVRFNALVAEHGRLLRHTIIQVCPKDLGLQYSDLEQEARLRLWRALESEREVYDWASYLHRIAVTTTLDAVRRVKRQREEQLLLAEDETEQPGLPPPAQISDPAPGPELVAEQRQVLDKVRAALARLPDNRRRAVGLHLEGLTAGEIGNLLGWTEAKARNLLYRGLHDLRRSLREAGIEYEID